MDNKNFEIIESKTYFDKGSKNIIAALEVRHENGEPPIFITGTFLGCSITTNRLIPTGEIHPVINPEESSILCEIDYHLNKPKDIEQKYLSLVYEHINYVTEANFSKYAMSLVHINWIPDELKVYVPREILELFQEQYEFMRLHSDGFADFINYEDIF